MALPPGCVRLKVYSETQPEIRGGREYRGLSAVELLEVLACRLWWSDLFLKGYSPVLGSALHSPQ